MNGIRSYDCYRFLQSRYIEEIMKRISQTAFLVTVTGLLWACQMDAGIDQKEESTPEENQVDRQLPQDKPPYIGHTLEGAQKLAAQQGYILRVKQKDGEALFGTTDVVPNRVDIAVENGIVVPW